MTTIIEIMFLERRSGAIVWMIVCLLLAFVLGVYADHARALIFAHASSIEGVTKLSLDVLGLLRMLASIVMAVFCGISLFVIIRDIRQRGTRAVPIVMVALLIIVCLMSSYSEYRRHDLLKASYGSHLKLVTFERQLYEREPLPRAIATIKSSRDAYLDRYVLYESYFCILLMTVWSMPVVGSALQRSAHASRI